MKTIIISIKVPDDYKFLAVQPYGDINLFKNKPSIISDGEKEEYWDLQNDEISVFGDASPLLSLNMDENWKNSLKEI